MKILIVDDHPIYAEGLQNLLGSFDFTVVGIASNGKEAVKLAIDLNPDIILMDVNMPGSSGIEAATEITNLKLPVKIVMLTSIETDKALLQSIQAGAAGYLLKNLNGEELRKNLVDLIQGKNPFSPGMQQTLLDNIRNNAKPEAYPKGLNLQQTRILDLLCSGKTYKEIGAQLFISERTVKYHISCLKTNLNITSQAQLINWYKT